MKLRDLWVAPPTQNATPLPASGRAGRNMPAAVTSALVLVGVLAVTVFLYRPAFIAIVVILVLGACWEMAGAFAREGFTVTLPPLYLGAVAMLITGAAVSSFWVMASLYFTFAAIVLWRLANTHLSSQPTGDVLASTFVAVYVPFSASFLALMSANSADPWTIVFFIVIVAFNDIGGWLIGIMFGKHPMAAVLSPKKTWEGFGGSLLFTTAASVVATFVLGIDWWWCFVFGVSAAVLGTVGDLFESQIKRQVGLKDMSGLVPGHGGLMDRFDSMLFTAPAFYFFYAIALDWSL